MSIPTIINKRAPEPPAGTARADAKETLLFKPLTIRGSSSLTVSPMQQYSAENGNMTPWHFAYLGGILIRGPGLTFVEGSAVTPDGRITPEDLGLWDDSQIASHKKAVDFAHSQNQKIGLQLMHAGRKGSCVALYLSFSAVSNAAAGGWSDRLLAPSAVPFHEGYPVPREMTIKEIEEHVVAFKEAARRAVTAGYDVLNIHAAHGYLLSEFLSPVANKRTDKYGGSFENRIRFLVEIVDAVRATVPDSMPIVVRVSATDCLEDVPEAGPSWTVPETVKLSHVLREHGVDVMDISSGGQSLAQTINVFNSQSGFAKEVKKSVQDSMFVGCLGGITSGEVAESYLQEGRGDVVFVGRKFLENPGAAWQFAEDLGVNVAMSKQLEWPFIGRGKRA
ncbi:FMN-linked oxidoreductase [Hymenopellis radicata]|nr:FMN-linked oxidoreductase [Hymenopellis radicata]